MHRFFVAPALLAHAATTGNPLITLPDRLAHQMRDVLRLGIGEQLVLLDNSSVAVESATANAAMNDLNDKITVILGTLDEVEATRMADQYDMVLVNILAHIIGGMAPQLAQVVAPDGFLIASGIIEARQADAEGPLLRAGLQLIERVMIDDWIALIMRKPG